MNLQEGLSSVEATKRLLKFGPNRIRQASKVQWWRVLGNQFTSPLVYILLLVIGVVLLLGEYADAILVAFAVVFNVSLGFIQEFHNEKVLEALNRLVLPTAKVKRDGQWQEIDAQKLVSGDVVRLEIGQSVPADGILVVEDTVHLNESILTGESVQVRKDAYKERVDDENLEQIFDLVSDSYKCFSGSTVVRGIGEMVVVFTGSKTKMGHIAHTVLNNSEEATPLQKKIGKLSNKLGLMVGVVIGLVCLVGLSQGMNLKSILPIAVSLAVAGIPEGLAISLALSLTIGMKRILKRKALVRKLVAAETLGQVDVICLDKTGTLTVGQMEAQDGVAQSDIEKLWVARGAVLCNDFRDPLEIAMNDWALKFLKLKDSKQLQDKYTRVDELPFDPKTKYIVTRHAQPDSKDKVEFVSGAPEVILKVSDASLEEQEYWKKQFVDLGSKGYRMVGFAYKIIKNGKDKIESNSVAHYEWLGVVTFIDPVREGVVEALGRAQKAGIGLKVITGDYKETAWSVLQQVGLATGDLDMEKVMLGDELKSLTGKALVDRVNQAVLFARTTPEQKDAIVQALQQSGHTVGMMGDGVNDAPALKRADIGVVVDKASDVARETADLILLDDNFDTLMAAVEEGRAIFESLRKVILYLLADAYSGVLIAVLAIAMKWPLPLVAIQILWVTFVHDGFVYLGLTAEPKALDLLSRKPLPKGEAIINRSLVQMILVVSVVIGLVTVGIFGRFYLSGETLELSRSLAMTTFAFCTLIYVFSARTLQKPLWSEGLFSNTWLLLGSLGSILLQCFVLYLPVLNRIFETVPLSGGHWIWVLGGCATTLIVVELSKQVLRFTSNQIS